MVKPWVFIAFVLVEAYLVAQGLRVLEGRSLLASARSSSKAQAESLGGAIGSVSGFWIAGVAAAALGRRIMIGNPTGPMRGSVARFAMLLSSVVLLVLGGLQVSFSTVDSNPDSWIQVVSRAVGLLVLLGSGILLVVALGRTRGIRKVVRASKVEADVVLDEAPLPAKEDT